jgi:hypothetical protein
VLPKVLKKGLLCLAFAGAIGGLTGCGQKKQADFPWDISPDKLNQQQQHVRSTAIEAEIYQARTEQFKRALKKNLVTQAEYDEGIKYDDMQIAQRRQEFVGTIDEPFWDGFFRNEMKKQGWTPRETMPTLEAPKVLPGPLPPKAAMK